MNSAASLDNLLATVVGAGEFVVLFLSLINVVVCASSAFFCTNWSLPFRGSRAGPEQSLTTTQLAVHKPCEKPVSIERKTKVNIRLKHCPNTSNQLASGSHSTRTLPNALRATTAVLGV